MYQKHAPIFLFHFFGVERFDHTRRLSPRHVRQRAHLRPQWRDSFELGNVRPWPHPPNSSFRRRLDCARGQHAAGQQFGKCAACDSNAVKDGSKITLADEIDSRQEARWVVSQIETLAGLKLDTHVEVDLPLGVSPQPLRQSSGQVFTPSQQRVPAAASAGVFLVMVAGMIGFTAWRMTSFSSRTNNSRTAAAASAAKPVTRRVFPRL